MGKKKGAGGAAKKGQPQESKKDFDDLLKQLNQATATNENLAIHSKESGTKDKKLSAKARLEQIKSMRTQQTHTYTSSLSIAERTPPHRGQGGGCRAGASPAPADAAVR